MVRQIVANVLNSPSLTLVLGVRRHEDPQSLRGVDCGWALAGAEAPSADGIKVGGNLGRRVP